MMAFLEKKVAIDTFINFVAATVAICALLGIGSMLCMDTPIKPY